jgi:TPP-dependent indolepyruvate ferredoxin oxidoreductase alpha subunit
MNASSQSYANVKVSGDRIASVSAVLTEYTQRITINVSSGDSSESVTVVFDGVKVKDVMDALSRLDAEIQNFPNESYPGVQI